MKRPRVVAAIKRSRAERFTKKVRTKVLDWDIRAGQPRIAFGFDGARPVPTIEFDLSIPGLKRAVGFATTVDDAYELKREIEQAIDAALGI